MILLSLAAALAFAVAAVLQQHVAASQPAEYNLRPALVLRLVRHRLWLVGIAASLAGTVLQLTVLWNGSLVAVQPLLVCGLLFALVINAVLLQRRRPGARELLAGGTVCIGLVLLLVATDPRRGTGSGSAVGWAVALGLLGVAESALVLCALASHKATWRAGLLATAGGFMNGLSAAFTKGVASEMESDWHRGLRGVVTGTLSDWELYAFGATLLLGVLLVQSAFQSGPIRWSLPALTAANPIASVLLGSTLLGEQLRSGYVAATGAVAGLGLVVTGIMALSSSSFLTSHTRGETALRGYEPSLHVPEIGDEPGTVLASVPQVASLPAGATMSPHPW